jgi:cleavage stimulation factor subunit 3
VHCGHDKDSRGLWDEYIAFMKEPVASHTPEGQQKTGKQIEEEQHQRNLLIRKVYQRAVQIPFRDVEEVWSDYEAFENKLDKTLAKGLMSKCMPSYMQARQVYRNLRTMTPPLYPPVTTSASVPGLFLPAPPTFTAGDRALVAAWKAYLKWEESNPLELEDKDKATLNHRLTGAYRAALVRMRFFSEIWYMAYQWHRSIGKDTEAEALLKTGLEANPTSFVLNFAQAEVLETKNSLAEAHELYSTFLRKLESELEDVEARTSSANSSIMSDPNVTANDSMLSLNPNLSQVSSQGSQGPPVVEDKKGKELKDRKAEYGVVWVKYMRFARRAEGLQAARDVFKKARQSKWTPWEVYDASGQYFSCCRWNSS